MRSLSVTALIFVLASTACATLNTHTAGFLETREPATRPKLCPCRPNRVTPCKEVGEACSSASDCCGTLQCSSGKCYESRY
ncbi:hypothetical protein LY78DRAFT_664781 [Colletotrichum sublineola]|nr:hypothetical protein LY78DRAFT_664781 [Colletotrichum sublineola]